MIGNLALGHVSLLQLLADVTLVNSIGNIRNFLHLCSNFRHVHEVALFYQGLVYVPIPVHDELLKEGFLADGQLVVELVLDIDVSQEVELVLPILNFVTVEGCPQNLSDLARVISSNRIFEHDLGELSSLEIAHLDFAAVFLEELRVIGVEGDLAHELAIVDLKVSLDREELEECLELADELLRDVFLESGRLGGDLVVGIRGEVELLEEFVFVASHGIVNG